MSETQLTTLVAAIFMSGSNPLTPEAAAEKARELVRAMSYAIAFSNDDDVRTHAAEDTPTRTETMETRKTYFDYDKEEIPA